MNSTRNVMIVQKAGSWLVMIARDIAQHVLGNCIDCRKSFVVSPLGGNSLAPGKAAPANTFEDRCVSSSNLNPDPKHQRGSLRPSLTRRLMYSLSQPKPNSMAFPLTLRIVILVLLCLTFCEQANAQLFRFGKKDDPLPIVFNRMPSQAELLQHLANNSKKFKQLSSDLRISLDGTPKLRGTMQLELPKRLRIKAGVMGVSQFGVDVGSNDQDFWVWTKVNLPNQKPVIFHASHKGFKFANSSVKQAIPLEPVWLLEGLGLIQFEASDVHKGPELTPEGHLRLYTIRQTPGGRNIRVTLIHAQHGTVLQQALYDQQNRLIAYTDSLDYKSFPQQRVALPEKIEMHLFGNGQHSKMVIEASDFQFDSLYGDPNQMWSMPQPNGVQAIDLTRIR